MFSRQYNILFQLGFIHSLPNEQNRPVINFIKYLAEVFFNVAAKLVDFMKTVKYILQEIGGYRLFPLIFYFCYWALGSYLS